MPIFYKFEKTFGAVFLQKNIYHWILRGFWNKIGVEFEYSFSRPNLDQKYNFGVYFVIIGSGR